MKFKPLALILVFIFVHGAPVSAAQTFDAPPARNIAGILPHIPQLDSNTVALILSKEAVFQAIREANETRLDTTVECLKDYQSNPLFYNAEYTRKQLIKRAELLDLPDEKISLDCVALLADLLPLSDPVQSKAKGSRDFNINKIYKNARAHLIFASASPRLEVSDLTVNTDGVFLDENGDLVGSLEDFVNPSPVHFFKFAQLLTSISNWFWGNVPTIQRPTPMDDNERLGAKTRLAEFLLEGCVAGLTRDGMENFIVKNASPTDEFIRNSGMPSREAEILFNLSESARTIFCRQQLLVRPELRQAYRDKIKQSSAEDVSTLQIDGKHLDSLQVYVMRSIELDLIETMHKRNWYQYIDYVNREPTLLLMKGVNMSKAELIDMTQKRVAYSRQDKTLNVPKDLENAVKKGGFVLLDDDKKAEIKSLLLTMLSFPLYDTDIFKNASTKYAVQKYELSPEEVLAAEQNIRDIVTFHFDTDGAVQFAYNIGTGALVAGVCFLPWGRLAKLGLLKFASKFSCAAGLGASLSVYMTFSLSNNLDQHLRSFLSQEEDDFKVTNTGALQSLENESALYMAEMLVLSGGFAWAGQNIAKIKTFAKILLPTTTSTENVASPLLNKKQRINLLVDDLTPALKK